MWKQGAVGKSNRGKVDGLDVCRGGGGMGSWVESRHDWQMDHKT